VKRWLVTGAGGMLGRDLVSVLEGRGAEVAALRRTDLDITDRAAVRAALWDWQPDVVVNCAAWTAVDDAEAHEADALLVNGQAVTELAAVCADQGTVLVQPSTDYVFSGQASQPYPEDSPTAPRSAYGRTKLAGEHAVLDQPGLAGYVVRTAWLYGAFGKSFVGTMIGRARRQLDVQVVDDQRGQPTWTVDVAGQIAALVAAAAEPGIYHATSSADTTWFELAQEVYQRLGADPARVRPVRSADYGAAAPRPAYSVLGHAAWAEAGIPPIGDWRDALHRALPCLLCASGAL
jgi:dTDP-4-dehydrorhamnose reductase